MSLDWPDPTPPPPSLDKGWTLDFLFEYIPSIPLFQEMQRSFYPAPGDLPPAFSTERSGAGRQCWTAGLIVIASQFLYSVI